MRRLLRAFAPVCLVVAAVLIISACRHPKAWQPVPHAPSIAAPTKDFTLIWEGEDANGGPLNPYWALEKTQNEIPPREQGHHPYPCETDPYSAACTENQKLVEDLPEFPNNVICKIGNPAGFDGHADWVVGSQSGCVDWEDQSADQDYNFRLFPPNPNKSILTKNNNQYVGLEFDYGETIANAQSPFWKAIREQVELENNGQQSRQRQIGRILNGCAPEGDEPCPGTNPRAAVTGLVGLDCEHGCKSEIHPVLAYALETNPDPNDNTWQVFVRNWGDEGFCSHFRHLVDFPDNQMNVLLFDDGGASQGMTVVPEKSHVFASVFSGAQPGPGQVSFPAVSYWQGHGPVLSFRLPAPETTQLFVEVEIHLKWNTLPRTACPAPPQGLVVRAAAVTQPSTAEEYWQKVQQLKPAAPPTGLAVAPRVAPAVPALTVPSSVAVGSFTPPSKAATVRRVNLPTDKQRGLKNTQDVQAACQASNNQLPKYQGQDLSGQLCDQKQIAKALKANR